MNSRTEVRARGITVGDKVLLVCTLCGPVAVTDLPACTAVTEHITEHTLEDA